MTNAGRFRWFTEKTMDKMWAGRFNKPTAEETDEFNSSIGVDKNMYAADIKGSIAHACMLGAQNIISSEDAEAITAGLEEILADIESGTLKISDSAEDIHMFIEGELTARIGDAGRRLHTARSRNDQVATDTRLYLAEKTDEVMSALKYCVAVLKDISEENKLTVMPGYTHLQRAQPVTLAHHMLAYCAMLMRDFDRLEDCKKRMSVMPLGSCALAGTTYPIDRFSVSRMLGFEDVCFNSMDGVSDRDFVIELSSALAIIMMHLSRLAEEVILWSSWEFKFLELDDAYSTGSSIMPQKKNPDVAELVRGKTGRVYGNLMGILTVMKGLPLAYNKDMQEDKEGVFDSVETVCVCLKIFADMMETARFLPENMLLAAKKGFINATDCADYLTKKGMPFRTAYKITGKLVALCIEKGYTLDNLPIEEYRGASELFDEDVYSAVDIVSAMKKRNVYGGPGPESVEKQLNVVRGFLEDDND